MLRVLMGAVMALLIGGLAHAQTRVETIELNSKLVPSPVKVSVLLPAGYQATQKLPLLLMLHGGGGDNSFLERMRPTVEAAWTAKDFPPAVVVTPDVGRSLYMDFKDGSQKWETFLVTEMIPELRRRYGLSAERGKTVVTGISMGGLGSLRLGFDHPEVFGGLAAMEPGIEPALAFDDVKMRNRFQRDDAFFASIFGEPVDRAFWKTANPANMVLANRNAILKSGLAIYLEVGDQDMFHLDEGAEYLHRVMWDHGIPHEYRLVRGADHTGKTVPVRMRDALRFLDREVLNPLPADETLAAARPRIERLRRAMGVPDDQPRPPLPPTSPAR
ncbi:MAG: esterase [Alphaproteobacteria bacterium]|nr:esterase [Alphaproteobacteria bacterium]MBU1513479.1 esterase [Alphaproteobacteria bacterium]MBU2096471.1 esterase [Alphaproteobacteria bacterium]MBU2149837.1 esterase [Alphaproteobacteria bacterium]MBU2308257.1 esterase [Alphaproteobacteria bacterium]